MADRNRIVAIHQPEHLPWLGFFDKLRQTDVFVLLDSVQFEKNYFQNRNRIRTAQGWQWLTVPVRMKGRFGQAIRDVEIDATADWPRKHAASLRFSYGGAPWFERLWPSFAAIYERPWVRLADLNRALIEEMIAAFGYRQELIRASDLGGEGSRSALLLDLCRKAGATEYLSGISGLEYLDREAFERAGVAVRFQEFRHPIYGQSYEPFVPALSALDLLFNHGPDSRAILESAEVPRIASLFT